MGVREFCALAPLAALCLWIGVAPQATIDLIRPDVESVAKLFPESGPPRAKTHEEPQTAAVRAELERVAE